MQFPVYERLDSGVNEGGCVSAVQSSHMNLLGRPEKALPGQPICPPETSAGASEHVPVSLKGTPLRFTRCDSLCFIF